MANNKKKPTDAQEAKKKAQEEKMHAQAAKARAKRAKQREKDAAKREREAKQYEKAKEAERKRVAEEREKEAARAEDPKYQAKQAKEAERLKEKGRKEVEKTRKRSEKKAASAQRSKEKVNKKNTQRQKKDEGLKSAAPKTSRPKRRPGNVIALIVICALTIGAVFLFTPLDQKITMGLDIEGGVSVNVSAATTDGDTPSQEQMDEAQQVITNRVNASGASASSVQQQGSNSFLIQVPGADDSQAILDTLNSQGVLEFVRVDEIDDEDVQSYIEQGITGMNLAEEGIGYEAFMTGDNVTTVNVSREENSTSYAVDLSLDGTGTSEFADVTTELVSNHGQIAILLDGVVQSAPSVQSAITGGEVQITGNYTVDEANNLKAIINSGSLPVTLTIDQSSVVGPTLGQNALMSGIFAALIGLALVIIWLLVFYGGLGLLTGISIVFMACIYLGLLAALSAFGWFSLTLSGIAGVIVNIGLAADSSILMLECFHERLRKGVSIKSAAKTGVHEGIMTSIDADVVTLISALILYFFAMGDVRGFGLTLALGIICDLIIMALFSGPLIRLTAPGLIARFPNFFGIGDDVREGKYITEEVHES